MAVFEGHCTCGDVAFELRGAPLFRAFCHCSICRAYHNADWADVTVFREKHFERTKDGHVTYKVHMQPPLLKRGTCDSCSAPVLEKVMVPGLPKLRLIPTRWIAPQADLPDPAFHLFYDLRLKDVDDDLPKALGYWKSQITFSSHMIRGLLAGSR